MKEIIEEDPSVISELFESDLSPYVAGTDYEETIGLVEGKNEIESTFVFFVDTEPIQAKFRSKNPVALENYKPSTSPSRIL
jgi:hypothetical protein